MVTFRYDKKKQTPHKTPDKARSARQKSTTESENKKPKDKYRVRNWASYNESLKNRGSITLWIDEDVIQTWIPNPQGPKKHGGQKEYTDGAIECLLMVKNVSHLGYRQTEGFASSMNQRLGMELPIPDYTTLNRRAAVLKVVLPSSAKGPIHAVLDSTGLKVYGEGEWKVRKHGDSKRCTWRKLHLCVDETSGEIEAKVLTDAKVDDAEVTEELLKQTKPEIKQISADGAYDKEKVYQTATLAGIEKIMVPPRRDAVLWEARDGQVYPRNANLRRVQEIGRAEWKVESGYHRRSLAETAMFRFKIIFGDRMNAREEKRQRTEVRIKCAALNRMTHLGMPDIYYCVS